MEFKKAEYRFSCGTAAQLPKECGGEVVFSGRSNVGKSSLINKLCTRKSLARVSATPGKTTTINFFSAGEGWMLVDLPGYGYAKRSQKEMERWAALMEAYFQSGRDIRLVVQLIDMRHKPTADDRMMLSFLKEVGLPTLVVLTKADKLNKTEYKENLAMLTEIANTEGEVLDVVPFTVNGEEAAQQLRDKIVSLIME